MKQLTKLTLNQRGASLLELMMVLAIAGFALTAIVKFIARANGSMARVEGTSELVYANQRISENLRQSMLGATDLVANYGGPPDFSLLHQRIHDSLTASTITPAPSPVTFSVQPIIQNSTTADLTSGAMASYVGNELYFISTLPPITVTVNLSGTALTGVVNKNTQGYVVSVDRMQFVALYLAFGNGSLKNGKKPLRLVEWRSSPYAVLGSLTQTGGGAYMTGTCQAMLAAGYTIAIDSSNVQDVTASYWSLSGTGVILPAPAPATFAQSSWAYVDEFNLTQSNHPVQPRLDWGRVLGQHTGTNFSAPSTFSFAYNNVTSASNPIASAIYNTTDRNGGKVQVPDYAIPDQGFVNFPGGFEVLVVGRPGAREILIRHVLLLGMGDIISKGRNEFLASDGQDYFTANTTY